MSRRVVSLTLMLTLLLTQWVNLHRRYDGCAACGRPPAPHVHLSELVPFAERPQTCRCGIRADADDHGCCNRKALGGEGRDTAVTEPSGSLKGCCADVLLLSADSEVTLGTADAKSDSLGLTHDAVLLPQMWSADRRHGPAVGAQRSPPAPSSAPLYLLNRALLI